MTTVYLDASALMIPAGIGAPAAGQRVVGVDCVPDHEADRMVDHLLECGHRVVLLGDDKTLDTAQAALPLAGRVALAPDGDLDAIDRDAVGWLISDSSERFAEARQHRRLKTVLIGASASTTDLAHRPADRLARSLHDAVLGVLATEAMPAVASARR